MTLTNNYDIGHNFESDVFNIINRTAPYSITHYEGGADRGRDIVVNYLIEGITYEVIIQCKCYTKAVSVTDIASTLDWAKVHRPALVYFWVEPYLSASAKDYIDNFSKEYKISVAYEERESIAQYKHELNEKNSELFEHLKFKITANIKSSMPLTMNPVTFSEDDCFLVDREDIRSVLLNSQYHVFYLQGISCCGKTQILKNIALYHSNQGEKIFWLTLIESNEEIQLKTFWSALASFFAIEYNNYQLNAYFQTYGNHLTSLLWTLVKDLISKYAPIIFLDDIHKCHTNNHELRELLISIIAETETQIYFSGWFNIFPTTPITQYKIKTILVDGMPWEQLDAIIVHNTGNSNPLIAQKIYNDYNGLPGFAAIVGEQTDLAHFESDRTFLYSVIEYLTKEEIDLLFAFINASIPLSEQIIHRLGYYSSLCSLISRKLILKQGNNYIVHEKYRSILSSYPMSDELIEHVIGILLSCSSENNRLVLDIAKIYCDTCRPKSALNILEKNFHELLHRQSPSDILKAYQLIEQKGRYELNLHPVMVKKAILSERCELYDNCQLYIEILRYSAISDIEEEGELLYLELRCLYFKNEYDKLLTLVHLNIEKIFAFPDEIIQQILLITGRIYFIRGLPKEAAYFYLFAYSRALGAHNVKMIAKIVHRVAMVELSLGYVSQSLKTFQLLLSMDELITTKRKSYIYYRLAECHYKMGAYDNAQKYNDLSYQLKKSIGHTRGLIFSHYLNSKIALKTGNYPSAQLEIKIATQYSQKLGLHKERIDCILQRIEIERKPLAAVRAELLRCFEIAREERLLQRLERICNLTEYQDEALCQDAHNAIVQLSRQTREEFDHFACFLNRFYPGNANMMFCALFEQQQSISKKLLILAGLINPY